MPWLEGHSPPILRQPARGWGNCGVGGLARDHCPQTLLGFHGSTLIAGPLAAGIPRMQSGVA